MHHASAIDDNGSNFCYHYITALRVKLSHIFNIAESPEIYDCVMQVKGTMKRICHCPHQGSPFEMLIENEGSGLVVLCSRVAVG